MLKLKETYDRMCLELAATLTDCRAGARPRTVHELRTTSRRLEALLKVVLFEHHEASKARKTVRKVLELLHGIRKNAGAVRDCDVQRRMISNMGKILSNAHRSDSREEVLNDVKAIQKALGIRKKKHKKRLIRRLDSVEIPLQEALHKCEQALSRLRPKNTTPQQCAMRWMKAIKLTGVDTSEERMHDFRKRTKGARYIAELQAEAEPSVRFAKKLHSVHDAIGLWHDYAILAIESKALLEKSSPLLAEMRRQRDHRWKIALRSFATFKKSQEASSV